MGKRHITRNTIFFIKVVKREVNAKYDGIIGRPLQLAACKSAIVSQPTESLQEKFGDNVIYVNNTSDIIQAIDYYKIHPQERHKRILQAYSILNTHYTAEIVGRLLYEWI